MSLSQAENQAPRSAPKHRAERDHTVLRAGVRTTLVTGGVAAVATGVTVGGGVMSAQLSAGSAAVAGDFAPTSASAKTTLDAQEVLARGAAVTRSADDRRAEADRIKQRELGDAKAVATTGTQKIDQSDPKDLARALLPEFGMTSADFQCVDNIWSQESGWNTHADNPSSSAYGIPQALPGSKMASAGPDWENNAETQIRWGLGYIQSRYGSACSAWGFKQSHGWY
ncbi:hypothetical protein GCM10011519_30140 [Marmoricola endophyticus]|uniref:Lytic transglycosylase domain-containing protein n=1 Tax=Marmoricola endophyticus TaxID=2040280 RepID=A0A917F6N3_9ACTN|nr:lytic transglycosylase domain-containing protein [Marmoricola endophyticus]GGF54204.1 hypothetical protein GCM10011519_30140 [Marmoricola endophyticus]